MSKLDEILATNIVAYDAGNKLMFSLDGTKQQIKDLFLELIGEFDEADYDYGEAGWGDSKQIDHASVIYGMNEKTEELRQKVEEL